MRLMEIAMNTLSPEERKTVIQLKKEVDEAAQQAGETSFDKRLEFCYAVKFSQDKIKSTRMLHAVESYIRAVEG